MVLAIQKAIRAQADAPKGAFLARFFKTGPGQYAEGDIFLGLTVPTTRKIVKDYGDKLTLTDIANVLTSKYHEERLAALIALVTQVEKNIVPLEKAAKMYLAHTKYINNWDLVDTSASAIIGAYAEKQGSIALLKKLAGSKHLWERRIAMVATFHFIKKGSATEAFTIATMLLSDEHDLIQKAVGWMLREVGKRADQKALVAYLHDHIGEIKSTSLRYAIEHFPPDVRKQYLALKRLQTK